MDKGSFPVVAAPATNFCDGGWLALPREHDGAADREIGDDLGLHAVLPSMRLSRMAKRTTQTRLSGHRLIARPKLSPASPLS